MYFIPLIILVEILVGVFAAIPNHKNNYYAGREKNILGESDADNSSEQTSESTPAQTTEPTNVPSDTTKTEIVTPAQTEVTPSDQSNTTTTSEPNTTSDSPSPTQEVITSSENTPVQIETSSTEQTPQEQNTIKSTVESLDNQMFSNVSEQNAAEKLSEKTVNEVKQEEAQLDSAKTPEEQIQLLTQFHTNDIQTIHQNLQENKQDDLAFNVQRLSSQIDKSFDTIQSLNPEERALYKNKIKTICENTEYLLRPGQLAVSEDTENKFEIARGECFNFEQQ